MKLAHIAAAAVAVVMSTDVRAAAAAPGRGQVTHGPMQSGPHQPGSKPTGRESIATRIESHPQLASRLQRLLPPNSTLETAAAGFKNQGQFIAALHVSHNLGIPFDQLKTQMVTDGRSLGQSIQMLKPSADVKVETRKAESEAKDDVAKSK
jgi:hypothetical protein